MHILYVTLHDPLDPNAWSGTAYNIPRALKRQGAKVDYLGNLEKEYSRSLILLKRIINKTTTKQTRWGRQPSILKGYARQIEEVINRIKPDVILSESSVPVAMVQTNRPVIIWGDAVFGAMVDFYPNWNNFHPLIKYHGNYQETRALNNATKAVFSSTWAAKSAISLYGIDPGKVEVINYGANNSSGLGYEAVKTLVSTRSRSEKIQLLFISVDWHRKGGKKALKIAKHLYERGFSVNLNIVGCKPNLKGWDYDNIVTIHGFVDKRTKEGKAKMDALFREASFLLLPAIADCSPIVIAEANSWGIPCLVNKVGGLNSLVSDGKNGYLFDQQDDSEKWAIQMEEVIQARDYINLGLTSFQIYEEQLNWDVAGKRMLRLMSEVLD